jgi:methoxymalonate biosynthesis acyl carrier protein
MERTVDCKKEVRDYILSNAGLQELDDAIDILDSGIVNSLFVIQLMTFLEKEFSIKITMDDLDMSNFRSVDSITGFVQRKMSR